ncbi:MAG: ABC transporter ATP-binding protein [Burkholderiaceae bacterium]|nr:ABC transporter ATP-binding protein [Burkholderiaceae bacterium]
MTASDTFVPYATALEVRGVQRQFGGLVALKNVSFSVARGEIVGLIGPNGAGKSTLFEVISGNIPPNQGRIEFFGKDITTLPPYLRRRNGLCRTFQKIRLFEALTVEQNIAVAAQQCAAGGHWKEEVGSVLEKLRLTAQAKQYPFELTLPDRKKVEIGRAIAGHCELLMLDESLSGLTRGEADEVVEEILLLNRSGLTVVIVEHVMPLIMSVAQRLVVLQHGSVIANGSPAEVAADPVVIEAYLGAPQKPKP